MKKKFDLTQIIFIIGVIAVFIGAVDPLEGSVVILFGSFLLVLSSILAKSKSQKLFLYSFVMIMLGVFALFYLSSLGGFGGNSKLSWWWGIFILPYPVGWLIIVITLIKNKFKLGKIK